MSAMKVNVHKAPNKWCSVSGPKAEHEAPEQPG